MASRTARLSLIRKLLSILVALILFAWLASSSAANVAFANLSGLSWPLLALLFITQSLSYLCRAGRLFCQLNARVSLGFAGYLRISLLHNMSVNVLPFRGGEVTLPVMLQRAGLSLSEAIATLVWLRVQDAIVLAVLALALWPGLPVTLRLIGTITLLFSFFLGTRLPRQEAVQLPESRWKARIGATIRAISPVFDAPITSWSWSICNWTCKLLGLTILLAALGGLSQLDAAGGVLGGELSALLPIQGVAGFGTYEAGIAFVIEPSPSKWQPLLAAAFALHCVTLLLALIAGGLAWFFLPPVCRGQALNCSSESSS